MCPFRSPKVSDGDISVGDFANLLSGLPGRLPITTKMEEIDGQRKRVWYSSQRQHMVSWFRSQATKGQGSYSRATPNLSAKATYNRLQCPEALIWIAEALGADQRLVQSVADEALQVNRRSSSGFIRKQLPWELIYELAQAKQRS